MLTFSGTLPKYLKDDKYHCLHLVQKYAKIFVPLHNLFRDVNTFLKAKLEGNFELQRTDTSKEIYPGMFLCQIETIVYLWSIKYFCLHDLSEGFRGPDIHQLKLGHYLFLEAHSFPWSSQFSLSFALKKLLHLGTDNFC